ncbi:MAG: hypothetical protein IKR75_03805 [Fibrobacter sp.]|nr:hypothetical protein [Fibrobacter sp.]
MRLKYAFSLVTAAALLAACDSTVTNTNDDAKAEGNITIMVVDNHSGAALSGATVYSVTDDKAVVGDSLGRSVWKKRALGDHSFQVSKDGYATVHTQVNLAEQGQGDVPRVGDVVQTVPMYKAGVLAKGIVLYNDDKGKLNAASKATVYANLPPQFVPCELSTQTNDKGEYSFDNLPEGVEIDISVGQELIDSKKYVGDAVLTIGGASYRAGDLINVGTINLVKTSAQIVKVADNTSEIDTVSDVTFTFAAELEADSVNVSKWTVTKGGNDVLVTVALSSDKRTVSVTPYTEKWTKGSTYSVRGTVYSVDGSSSTVSASFTVGGGSTGSSARPGNVDGLKITEDPDYTYYIHLSWNEAKGDVYRYNIYRKTNLVNDFAFYTSTADTTYRIDLDDFSSSVTDVYYIVLPVNDDGVEADIAGARSVKYTIE